MSFNVMSNLIKQNQTKSNQTTLKRFGLVQFSIKNLIGSIVSLVDFSFKNRSNLTYINSFLVSYTFSCYDLTDLLILLK